MMAQIANFTGGINSFISPYLLPANEALVANNVDITSGSLKPAKSDIELNIPVDKTIFNFNDTWLSGPKSYIVEINNKLFSSDGVNVPKKSVDGTSWHNLGIIKPEKPSFIANYGIVAPDTPEYSIVDGDLTDTLVYCYTYYNSIDDVESKPSEYTDSIQVDSEEVKLTIIASVDEQVDTIRLYRYGDNIDTMTLVKELENEDQVFTDNIQDEDLLGYELSDKNLTGTVSYCYTYYNSLDGTESQPSEYTGDIWLDGGFVVISVEASDDIQVDTIKIYRLGTTISEMSLVTELQNVTSTYKDNLKDLDIIGDVLDSYGAGQAPTGLKNLIEAHSTLVGSIDNILYYSEQAYYNNWDPLNFVEFDSTITGIGQVSNGVLVFTKYKTYILSGTSPNLYSKYLLGNVGCTNHFSISAISNTLIWCSESNICMSSGGTISMLTDKFYDGYINSLLIVNSVAYDDIYYLNHSNGLLKVDFRKSPVVTTEDFSSSWISYYNGKIYYSNNGYLNVLNGSAEPKKLSYKTPKITEGSVSTVKSYKTIYCSVDGELSISVYINSYLVGTYSVSGYHNEIKVPQISRQGNYIEFSISGTGELLELEYIVEGRQNGR